MLMSMMLLSGRGVIASFQSDSKIDSKMSVHYKLTHFKLNQELWLTIIKTDIIKTDMDLLFY